MIILAPMAGVNNAAFRLMCRQQGADIVNTAMIHVNSLCAEPNKVIKSIRFLEREKPISVQLVGNSVSKAKEATKIISDYADYIDINLGCPEDDIIKSQSGAWFMKHPEEMEKFVNAIVSNTNKPVTAKIRTGWEKHNTMEYIKILENLGLKFITIHARTVEQGYSGKADWSEIKKAVEETETKIVGNGDIFKPGTAKAMKTFTGCEGIMIGRAAVGNPFIFKRTKYLLENDKNMPETSRKEKIEGFLKWMKLYAKHEDNRSFTEIKQQSMWFLKGLDKCKRYKILLGRADDIEEIKDIYEEIYR